MPLQKQAMVGSWLHCRMPWFVSFVAMPGLCCFLRVTQANDGLPAAISETEVCVAIGEEGGGGHTNSDRQSRPQ